MPQITIIEIKSDNLKEYKAFLAVGLVADEDNFRITVNDDLNTNFPTKDKIDSFTLGAYFENELVGIVSFVRDGLDREKLRHKGVLFRMYVSPNFRGKGIARKLIEALIDKVKCIDDIEQINLTVIANNQSAKILYTKLGFEEFGFEKNAIKWGNKYFDETQMVLKLE